MSPNWFAVCTPWLLLLIGAFAGLRLLLSLSRSRFRWRDVARLHGDQAGGVQSLSFVLTLPLFVSIVMFILQVSQMMIARVVVEYAAFAAARSANSPYLTPICSIPAMAASLSGWIVRTRR